MAPTILMFGFIYIKYTTLFAKKNRPFYLLDINFINVKKNFFRKNFFFCMKSQFSFSDKNERKKNRIKANTNNEVVITQLQKIQSREFFLKFCNNNREHFSFNLLYRLTALKLKTCEGNEEEQEKSLTEFRKRVQESMLIIDQPFSQSLILAEKKLKESLKNKDDYIFVSENIGDDKLNNSCFWIVLNSAIIAWERKKSVKNKNAGTYDSLLNIKNLISKNPKYQEMLPHEMKFLQKAFENKSDQYILKIFDPSFLDGIKLIICYLEKLPSSSYGSILLEITGIYNICFQNIFKTKTQEIRDFNIQFTPKRVETQSRLAEIQKSTKQ